LGITNRFCTHFKQKENTLPNRYENPKEGLDYSNARQVKTLTRDKEEQAERQETDEREESVVAE
jgi:hypothetical protein